MEKWILIGLCLANLCYLVYMVVVMRRVKEDIENPKKINGFHFCDARVRKKPDCSWLEFHDEEKKVFDVLDNGEEVEIYIRRK